MTIMKLHTMRRLLLGLLAIIEAELCERGALPIERMTQRDMRYTTPVEG